MTKEDILKIKEHIEIHARREPRAVHITEIMGRAVGELEHIAELEKENAELKKKCYKKAVKDYCKLEKENAKLKAEIENDRDIPTVAYMQGAENQKKKDEKQLTKAKDLLNEFMRISKASDEDFEHDYSELIGEAEQFLQEIEK